MDNQREFLINSILLLYPESERPRIRKELEKTNDKDLLKKSKNLKKQ